MVRGHRLFSAGYSGYLIIFESLKLWKTRTADDKFSLWIRQRDQRCMYPGCSENDIRKLQASHYWTRDISATRFDPENVDALCYPHHYGNVNGWEYHKHCCYKAYRSPIFKVVQQKRCKALYTALTESLRSLEYAVGEGSERSKVERSVAVPP